MWRFEYIFAFVIIGILGLALGGAFWMQDKELINLILTAFIGGLSAITAFFFTKHQSTKKDDEQ